VTCLATCREETGYGDWLVLACRHDEGHELPHHDPSCHWDWYVDGDVLNVPREHTPYRCTWCTWSQTGYADGVVKIWPDQPSCGICGTKAAGFNPGEQWASA
jgi:hypothetical protein